MEVKIYYGRGGWSWYTGSASWYYRCGMETLLGFNLRKNILYINPHIPEDWEEYFVRYKHHSSIYNIKVINKYKGNEAKEIIINGSLQKNNYIQLIDNNKIYDVEVIV